MDTTNKQPLVPEPAPYRRSQHKIARNSLFLLCVRQPAAAQVCLPEAIFVLYHKNRQLYTFIFGAISVKENEKSVALFAVFDIMYKIGYYCYEKRKTGGNIHEQKIRFAA